jgi:hypothetical protein
MLTILSGFVTCCVLTIKNRGIERHLTFASHLILHICPS